MALKKEVEWRDRSVWLNGTRIAKLRGLDYGIKADKAHLFAEGDMPIGIQTGNKEPTGTLTVLSGFLDELYKAALASGAADPTDVQFDIVDIWKPSGNRGLKTVTLVQCELDEFNYAMMQGDKEMVCTLPFKYMDITPQFS